MWTKIADIFKLGTWASEDLLKSSELTEFIGSEFVTTNSNIQEKLNASEMGDTITLPYILDNFDMEAEYMDDGDIDATVNKLERTKLNVRAVFGSFNIGQTKMSEILSSGASALDVALSIFGGYWSRQLNRRVIASLIGAIASNKTNNGGDNVRTTSNQFSYSEAVDTLELAGENMDSFAGIAVHTKVYAQMLKNDEVQDVKDSETGITLKYYNGLRIIKSNLLPMDGTTVTTVFLRKDAFLYANKNLEYAVEYFRDPNASKGGGKEQVFSRKGFILSLNGYNFTSANVSGVSASIAECQDGTNWERVVDKELSPFVALESAV